MSWFRSDPPVRVDAEGVDTLMIMTTAGDRRSIRLLKLNRIAFADIGDSFLANENGWWLLGEGEGATGIWHECPVVHTAMRGPLAAAVHAVGDLAIFHLADAPKFLRSAEKAAGRSNLMPRRSTPCAAPLRLSPCRACAPSLSFPEVKRWLPLLRLLPHCRRNCRWSRST